MIVDYITVNVNRQSCLWQTRDKEKWRWAVGLFTFLFVFLFYFLFTLRWWSFEMTQTKTLLVSLRLSVQRTLVWGCSALVFNNGFQSKFGLLVCLIFKGCYCQSWWNCNTQRDAQWSSGFWCMRRCGLDRSLSIGSNLRSSMTVVCH